MNSPKRFSWKSRALSFRYAFKGFIPLLKDEHNMRIHLAAAMLAVIAGAYFGISITEWCVIILCIAAVTGAEALNSAVEALADKISPDHDPLIGKAKDVAATAVLIFAIGAFLCGALIFLPKIIDLI